MATGIWSGTEPFVEIATVDDLDRFVDFAGSKAEMPTAISVDVHGYRVDLLVGHKRSFVHMTPDDRSQPYHVTIGGSAEGGVDFWLHSWHHMWLDPLLGRHGDWLRIVLGSIERRDGFAKWIDLMDKHQAC